MICLTETTQGTFLRNFVKISASAYNSPHYKSMDNVGCIASKGKS